MKQSFRPSNKYQVFSVMRNYQNDTSRQDMPAFQLDENSWKNLIIEEMQQLLNPEYVAFIFHDKDKTEEGNPKTLHCHIVAKYKNPKSFVAAHKELNPYSDRKEDFGYATSEGGSLRYLTHRTENAMRDKKYPYNINEIHLYKNGSRVSDDAEIIDWYMDKISDDFDGKSTRKDKQLAKITEIKHQVKMQALNNKLDYRDLRKVVSGLADNREEIITQTLTRSFKSEIKQDIEDAKTETFDDKINSDQNFFLSNIYISGHGGSGKSTLARSLGYFLNFIDGEDRNRQLKELNGAGERKDIWDNYRNEHTIILNEYNYAYNHATFCDVFDNIGRDKNVSRRYKNGINTSRFAIFTKSEDFLKFLNQQTLQFQNTEDFLDKKFQIARRFQCNVHLNNATNKIEIFKLRRQGDRMKREKVAEFDIDIQTLKHWQHPKTIEILVEIAKTLDSKIFKDEGEPRTNRKIRLNQIIFDQYKIQ